MLQHVIYKVDDRLGDSILGDNKTARRVFVYVCMNHVV